MTKLTIGIGEDFPVEEKATQEDCLSRHRRDRNDHHERWHRWLGERFGRRPANKDKE